MKPTQFAQLWSVQLAGVLAILAVIEPRWPELAKVLPPGWAAIGAVLIAIARAVPQKVGEEKK